MLERKHHKVLSTGQFARRLGLFAGVAVLIVMFALSVGVAGYHWIAGFDWLDALLNASMILTGMGPVGELRTPAAKIFASAYALFSGLIFITVMGIIMTPVVHRVMHQFHVEEEGP